MKRHEAVTPLPSSESGRTYTVRLDESPNGYLERYAEGLGVEPGEAAEYILTRALEGWVRRTLDPRAKALEDRSDVRPWPW